MLKNSKPKSSSTNSKWDLMFDKRTGIPQEANSNIFIGDAYKLICSSLGYGTIPIFKLDINSGTFVCGTKLLIVKFSF